MPERRMGMTSKPNLQPAYTYNRKPIVIDAEPSGLEWSVELWEGGRLTRVLARAENVALARGAFDSAMRIWPDDDVRLCCGEQVMVTSG
jgi:hypothetical protein